MAYRILLATILSSFVFVPALANICGTDYQNFNPLTSGIDFVTVHSSETIEPCYVNTGLFANYAVNSLTYSRSVGVFSAGSKPGDRLTTLDFNIGTGLSKNWDVGVSAPYLFDQKIDNADMVSSFQATGFTEVRVNTKYRFSGNRGAGWAGVFSVNYNLIRDNPFTGSNAGPTTNFEIVRDLNLQPWNLGFNFGYRKRFPGTPVAGVPIAPVGDQFIYSVGVNRLLPEHDSKLIFEIYGASFVNRPNADTDKETNALEWIGGIKHDIRKNLAVHIGGGTKIANSLASPDWRVYTGVNWVFGPVCDSAIFTKTVDGKITRFNVSVLFETDSDVIEPTFIPKLDRLVDALKELKFSKLTVEGHTDSVGSEAYNQDLSQRRAETVRRFLIDKLNVAGSKILAIGYGEQFPIASNGNYQGRVKNRRVEIKVEE